MPRGRPKGRGKSSQTSFKIEKEHSPPPFTPARVTRSRSQSRPLNSPLPTPARFTRSHSLHSPHLLFIKEEDKLPKPSTKKKQLKKIQEEEDEEDDGGFDSFQEEFPEAELEPDYELYDLFGEDPPSPLGDFDERDDEDMKDASDEESDYAPSREGSIFGEAEASEDEDSGYANPDRKTFKSSTRGSGGLLLPTKPSTPVKEEEPAPVISQRGKNGFAGRGRGSGRGYRGKRRSNGTHRNNDPDKPKKTRGRPRKHPKPEENEGGILSKSILEDVDAEKSRKQSEARSEDHPNCPTRARIPPPAYDPPYKALYKTSTPKGRKKFVYTETGELEPLYDFDAESLHNFIYTHPLGSKLTFWIQRQPSRRKIQHLVDEDEGEGSIMSRCRLEGCLAGNYISIGHFRIAIDELGQERGSADVHASNDATPYYYAAVFHLGCFESIASLPAIILRCDVRVDERAYNDGEPLPLTLERGRIRSAAFIWLNYVYENPAWCATHLDETLEVVLRSARDYRRKARGALQWKNGCLSRDLPNSLEMKPGDYPAPARAYSDEYMELSGWGGKRTKGCKVDDGEIRAMFKKNRENWLDMQARGYTQEEIEYTQKNNKKRKRTAQEMDRELKKARGRNYSPPLQEHYNAVPAPSWNMYEVWPVEDDNGQPMPSAPTYLDPVYIAHDYIANPHLSVPPLAATTLDTNLPPVSPGLLDRMLNEMAENIAAGKPELGDYGVSISGMQAGMQALGMTPAQTLAQTFGGEITLQNPDGPSESKPIEISEHEAQLLFNELLVDTEINNATEVPSAIISTGTENMANPWSSTYLNKDQADFFGDYFAEPMEFTDMSDTAIDFMNIDMNSPTDESLITIEPQLLTAEQNQLRKAQIKQEEQSLQSATQSLIFSQHYSSIRIPQAPSLETSFMGQAPVSAWLPSGL